jgi:hypothetical protein
LAEHARREIDVGYVHQGARQQRIPLEGRGVARQRDLVLRGAVGVVEGSAWQAPLRGAA